MTLLGLRLRSFLGWGLHPVELRRRSARFLRAFSIWCISFLLLPLFWFLAPALDHRHLQWPPTAASVRGLAVVLIYGLSLLVISTLAPAVASWWLARRGAGSVVTTGYGHCYAIRLDPPGFFFARIGETPRTAKWYSLPLDWDRIVSPSDAQYELAVLAATGWVERVHRLGASSREVSQPVPALLEPIQSDELDARSTNDEDGGAEADALDFEEEGATNEERRAMSQFARRANLGWRSSTRDLAHVGWIYVAGGAAVVLIGVVGYLALFSPTSPSGEMTQSNVISVLAAYVALIILFAIPCLAFGLRWLRAWRRYRRFNTTSPLTADGEVNAWVPYRDLYSGSGWQDRKETLISLRLPDGHEHVFRIPVRYLHRVRRRGARVRITYRPTTERVLEVAYADEPAPSDTGQAAEP
jgi:hypothetical protein